MKLTGKIPFMRLFLILAFVFMSLPSSVIPANAGIHTRDPALYYEKKSAEIGSYPLLSVFQSSYTNPALSYEKNPRQSFALSYEKNPRPPVQSVSSAFQSSYTNPALSYEKNPRPSVQSVSSVFQSSYSSSAFQSSCSYEDTNHLLIVLDPAHGYDVYGKRSPETIKRNGDIDTSLLFYEYQFSRKIIDNLEPLLDSVGIYHILSNPYDYEIGLRARVNNTNAYAKLWRKSPEKLFPDSAESDYFINIKKSSVISRITFFLSLHNNASGNGINWMKARGFSAWTSRHVSRSDLAADIFLDEFESEFPDIKIIGHRESNFAVLMCKPYAVLIECLFQDNKLDVLTLNDPDFQIRYTYVLLRSILKIVSIL